MMQLSSLTFTVLILPLLLAAYYLIPDKGKRVYLLTVSVLIYGWGSPVRILYPAAFLCYDYAVGLLLEKWRRRRALCTAILGVSVILQVAAMSMIRTAAQENDSFFFPAGIAIYTLQGLGYLIGIYRSRHTAAVRFHELALYLMLFPMLYAGPFFSYVEFSEQLHRDQKINIIHLSDGLGLFIRGLTEKVVLADTFGYVFRELRQAQGSEISMLSAWLTTIVFSMYLYFELLGCSEMARGLGKCFGFEMPKNFSHPFFTSSVTAFMQSWNITLLLWFQTNFRYFLFREHQSRTQKYAGLVLTWTLIGAWYGMKPQFLVWGAVIGLLLTLDQLVLEPVIRKHYVLGLGYTAIVLQFTWVLFFAEHFAQAVAYWKAMLGFGSGLADQTGFYFLTSYAALILIGLYIATDLFRNITERISVTPLGRFLEGAMPVVHGAMLLACLACMVHGAGISRLWLWL